MTANSKIPILVINLDDDAARMVSIRETLSNCATFNIVRVPGVYGKYLPDAACFRLTENEGWIRKKGEIGCFLSHARAWELTSKIEAKFCLIIEDDAVPRAIERVLEIDIPTDCDLIFINDRMSPGGLADPLDREVVCLPLNAGLEVVNNNRRGVGSYGYLLTPKGAHKLLTTTAKDLYYGNVDWRLVRYSVTPEMLEPDFRDSWIAGIIHTHHNRALPPAWGILRSSCINTPLVAHGIFGSRIEGH